MEFAWDVCALKMDQQMPLCILHLDSNHLQYSARDTQESPEMFGGEQQHIISLWEDSKNQWSVASYMLQSIKYD